MDNFSINFSLNPAFDVNHFNAILSSLKSSLGELGKDIKLIDEKQFNASMDAFRATAKQASESVEGIGKSAKQTEEQTKKSTEKAGDSFKKLGDAAGKSASTIKEQFTKQMGGLESSLKNAMAPMMGVFGGAAIFKGFSSILGSFNDMVDKGKASLMVTQKLSIAFAQAGKSGDELTKAIKETSANAVALSDRLAMPISEIRQYSQMAAALGGATGKANKDLTMLAIGIDKATNGLVSGEMAIRLFSKGVADPESQFALGRLTKQFPALAAALKDMKNPADATQKALAFFGPTFKELEKQATGPIGSMTRFENSLSLVKSSMGKVIIEGVAPFITSFAEQVIPVIKSGVATIGSLTGVLKPLKPIFVAAGVGVGTLVAGLLMLKGVNYLSGLAVQGYQFGLSIMKNVIPAMVTETTVTNAAGVSVTKLNMQWQLLTWTHLKSVIAQKALAIAQAQNMTLQNASLLTNLRLIAFEKLRIASLLTTASVTDAAGNSVTKLNIQWELLRWSNIKSVIAQKALAIAQAQNITVQNASLLTNLRIIAAEKVRVAWHWLSVTALGAVKAAFIAAFVAHPIGVVIASTMALVGAIALLSDWLHKSAKEREEDLKEEDALLSKQMANNKKIQEGFKTKQDLIKQYELLGTKVNRTAEEEKKFREVQLQLSKEMPGAIDATKSFSQNLEKLKQEAAGSKEELMKLQKEMRQMENQKATIKVEIEKAQSDQIVEQFGDIMSFLKTVGQDEGADLIQKYIGSMNNASSEADLEKVATNFKMAILNDPTLKILTPEQKQEFYGLAENMQKSLAEGLKAKEEQARTLIKNSFQDPIIKGVVLDPAAMAIIAMQTNYPIKELERMYMEMKETALKAKLNETIKKSLEIEGKIGEVDTLKNLMSEYESASKRIQELSSKSQTKGLTDSEQKELDALTNKVSDFGDKIGAIVPNARENFKTIVDSAGNIKEVFDINIQKANEFADTQKKSLVMDGVKDEFSNMLSQQLMVMDRQKVKLKELQAEIDATNDPVKKQALIDEYNKENQAIQKNRDTLLDAYSKGIDAGIVSDETLQKLTKTLGVNSNEAKKMLLGKALKNASVEGKLTEAQIVKLAQKYGVSVEVAKELYRTQQKITQEIVNSNNEIVNLALKLANADKEKEKSAKTAQDLSDKLRQLEEENEAIRQKIRLAGIKDEDEKSREEKKLALQASEQKVIIKIDELKKKKALNKQELQELSLLNEQLKLTQHSNSIELLDFEVGLARKKVDELKKLEEDEVKNHTEMVKTKIELLEKSIPTITNQEDYRKALEEQHKLQLESIKRQGDSQIEQYLKNNSSYLKAEETFLSIKAQLIVKEKQLEAMRATKAPIALINNLNNEITGLQDGLNKAQSEMNYIEEKVKSTDIVQNIIFKVKREESLEDESYADKLREAELKKIENGAVREREIKIFQAEKAYREEYALARDNANLQYEAFIKLQRAKVDAEQDYLNKTSGIYVQTYSIMLTSLQEAFNKTLTAGDEEKKIVDDKKKALKQQESDLRKSLENQEISWFDYYKKLNTIREDSRALSANNTKLMLKDLQQGMTDAFKLMQQGFQDSIKMLIQKYEEQAGVINAIDKEKAKNSEALRKELEKGDVNLGLRRMFHGAQIDNKLAKSAQKTSDIMSQAYIQAGVSIGSSLTAAVISGENALKAMAKTALSNFKAMIPLFVAQIFNVTSASPANIASLGLWGATQFTLLTGTLYGLASVAEAAIMKLKHGQVRIKGPGTQTSDSIPARLSVDESVISAKGTTAFGNEEMLQFINSGRSFYDYVFKVPKIREHIVEGMMERGFASLNKVQNVMVINNSNQSNDLRELQKKFDEVTNKLDEIKKEISEGNYTRKTINRVDVGIEIDDRELVKRTNIQRNAELRRR